MFQAKLHIFINISVVPEQIAFKPSQSGVNFSRRSQQGVTTLCFKQNCTFYSNPSNTCQSILSRLSPNLHKVGLIFQDDRNKGSQPYVPSKTAHFHQYLSSEWIAFKPLKVRLIFRDDHNKGSQPYVSSKTAHFIQTRQIHVSQFLADCLQTFTK